MLSHSVYNVLHVVGIILIMSSLGGVALHAMNGGTREANSARRLMVGVHGAGAFLVLLGGFGMLARIGFKHGEPFPGWLLVKITIWLLLAGRSRCPTGGPRSRRPCSWPSRSWGARGGDGDLQAALTEYLWRSLSVPSRQVSRVPPPSCCPPACPGLRRGLRVRLHRS